MDRTWGNVMVNAHIGLLFIDFESAKRIRVNGTAVVSADDPLLPTFDGAALVVRVSATDVFPNCPRYIHRMQITEHSPYAPRPDYPPWCRPAWKGFDAFRDHLPERDRVDKEPE